jgi:hypothetical protein
VIEIVSEAMKHVVEAISPEVKRVENLPQDVQLPLEDVQIAGEKVNYRIVLNPDLLQVQRVQCQGSLTGEKVGWYFE